MVAKGPFGDLVPYGRTAAVAGEVLEEARRDFNSGTGETLESFEKYLWRPQEWVDWHAWRERERQRERARRGPQPAVAVRAPSRSRLLGSLVHRVLGRWEQQCGVYTGERSLFECRDRLRSVMDSVDPDPGDAWIIDPKGGRWTLLHDEYRAYVDTHVPRQIEDMWWRVTSCLERARAVVSSDTLTRPMMIDTDVEVSRWVAGVRLAGKVDRVSWSVQGHRVVVDDWKTGAKGEPLDPGSSAVDPSGAYLQVGLYVWMLLGGAGPVVEEVVARYLHIGDDVGAIYVQDLGEVDAFVHLVLMQMGNAMRSGRVILPPWRRPWRAAS